MEELGEAGGLIYQRSVGTKRFPRERVHGTRKSAPTFIRQRGAFEGGEQRGRGEGFEVGRRTLASPVLRGNDLPLFGDSNAAPHRAGRLSANGGERRAAASAHRS